MACQSRSSQANIPAETLKEEGAAPVYQILSAADFAAKMQQTGAVQLVDVRRPEEFSAGHIEGASNIDFFGTNFNQDFEKLDKSKPVLLYCRTGRRSGASAKKLEAMGFLEIYDLDGGYLNWLQAQGGN